MTDLPKQVFNAQTPGLPPMPSKLGGVYGHKQRIRQRRATLTCFTVKPWICSPTRYCSALSFAATLFHLHALRLRDLKRHHCL